MKQAYGGTWSALEIIQLSLWEGCEPLDPLGVQHIINCWPKDRLLC